MRGRGTMRDNSCPCPCSPPPMGESVYYEGEWGTLARHLLFSMSTRAAARRLARLSSVSVFRCRRRCS